MSSRQIVSALLASPRYKFYKDLYQQRNPGPVVGVQPKASSSAKTQQKSTYAERRLAQRRETTPDKLRRLDTAIIREDTFRELITQPPKPREIYFTVLDATFGMGNDTRSLLSASKKLLRVLAMDVDGSLADPFASHMKKKYKSRFSFVQGSIAECRSLYADNTFDGIILDLNGPCEAQLRDDRRGFDWNGAFDGPCTLSYLVASGAKEPKMGHGDTLESFLNSAAYEDLMNVFADRAKLRYREANGLVNRILRARPIHGLFSVSDIFKTVFGDPLVDECSLRNCPASVDDRRELHQAKSYQAITALRERLNNERESFAIFLRFIPHLLKPLGRCAIRCSKQWQIDLLKEFETADPKMYCPAYPTDTLWIFQKHTKSAYPLKISKMLGSISTPRVAPEKDFDKMLRTRGISFDPDEYPANA